jgi:hypothetical protein
MPVLPNSCTAPRIASRQDRLTRRGAAYPQGTILAAASIGYLVPAAGFDGDVHSVFARACNLACADSLLTLVAPELGDGPTTLRLGRGARADLRALFRPGDRVRCRDGFAHSRGVALRLTGATLWRPAALRPMVPAPQIAAHLRLADAALARRRRTHSSVVDREGGAVLAGLAQACRELDIERALPHVERLVGWGEGLTPAGDDVLVGWCAALYALAGDAVDRRRFLRDFSVAIVARTRRTTPIAAHYLRLAAQGHFNADVTRSRDALLCAHDLACVAGALDGALGVGATSGADMVTGLIAGLSAWPGGRSGVAVDACLFGCPGAGAFGSNRTLR